MYNAELTGPALEAKNLAGVDSGMGVVLGLLAVTCTYTFSLKEILFEDTVLCFSSTELALSFVLMMVLANTFVSRVVVQTLFCTLRIVPGVTFVEKSIRRPVTMRTLFKCIILIFA